MELLPVVTWAGGKTRLLPEIDSRIKLINNKEITKYCEPFIGGGAVLFHILNNYPNIKKIYVSDILSELINVYNCIKLDVDRLIIQLSTIEDTFNKLDTRDLKKEYYYKIRTEFNLCKGEYDSCDKFRWGALFIALSKTCFNGVCRTNKKGEYNSPFGLSKSNKVYFNYDNLRNISKKFNEIEIVFNVASYDNSYDFIDSNTLVYFDPPYRHLGKNDSILYTGEYFDDNSQIELWEFCKTISNKGASFILSNSDPKNVDINDNFFDNLYKDFNINRVSIKRNINGDATKRNEITEIMVDNIR